MTPATRTAPALRILEAAPGPRWAAEHRAEVRAEVEASGAVLLRGSGVASPADLAAVTAALGIEPMAEREGFAPRDRHGETVYSASHWPADAPMCMHHEQSYAAEVPGLMVFGCLTAPDRGGRTMLADSQQVLRALPAGLVEPFRRDGWLLLRSYQDVGVPWTDAFGTEDRALVDAYCAAEGIRQEWFDGGLRTAQRRAAVVAHPRTGVPGWFNQIAFLNELTMDPVIREYLLDQYGPTGLPFTTAHGDTTPIDAGTVEAVNAAYDAAAFGESWRDGDVLVVDNIRMAHSREPYEGPREVAVVLGDPVRLPDHVLSDHVLPDRVVPGGGTG
ncbi:syringomycin biosynthesis enzyme [Kitasatospora xanthocidica]|uniref:TauD/TfdA family dioxygenase n=1 Tax=Kitasatospora xanthocidica TaxID=83382 RepID=UPI001672C0F6|nr:TauD/TfdA family dioxygenase [Kitasatospora xanthocidica]GHF37111.1 syringomycin biosynthesis enzyme [Kitasatospora xanthocidica]